MTRAMDELRMAFPVEDIGKPAPPWTAEDELRFMLDQFELFILRIHGEDHAVTWDICNPEDAHLSMLSTAESRAACRKAYLDMLPVSDSWPLEQPPARVRTQTENFSGGDVK